MTCQKNFARELRERGFRLTAQREMVLAVLHELDSHATADDIYQRVQRMSSAVDVSTVYRTLDLLQQFRLVSCVEAADGQRRYELQGAERDPHAHLVCSRCGAVLRAELSVIHPLVAQLAEQHGFQVDLGQFTIPGFCSRCSATPPHPRL
jgi:Fur family ferric uptake transcriptional regulator